MGCSDLGAATQRELRSTLSSGQSHLTFIVTCGSPISERRPSHRVSYFLLPRLARTSIPANLLSIEIPDQAATTLMMVSRQPLMRITSALILSSVGHLSLLLISDHDDRD